MKLMMLTLAAASLAACQRSAPKDLPPVAAAKGPVPESWYRLPEQGAAVEPGDLGRLGLDVDHLFAAQAAALPASGPLTAAVPPPADHPVDWVPWHLAILSADFALTTQGTFGALLFDGSADVQANWVRKDALQPAARIKTPLASKRPSDLVIRGNVTEQDVSRQLEPVIKAALATGAIHNEARFRGSVAKAADNFRLTALQLNGLGKMNSRFPLSAFRLEMSFGAEGQLTPAVGIGGAVNLRFDWIVPDPATSVTAALPAVHTPLGDSLIRFVRAVAPDVDAAVKAAAPIQASGYSLSSVRVGIGLTAQGNIGIVQGTASALGSVIFGDNDEEGGCIDPDGDGDCHNPIDHERAVADLTPATDDGIPLIRSAPSPAALAFAHAHGVAYQQLPGLTASDTGGTIFKIPHARFQAGLRKAIGISSFFTKHAAAVKGNWQIKELETEFDLSLTGTTGLVTVQGTGELELEFEHKGT